MCDVVDGVYDANQLLFLANLKNELIGKNNYSSSDSFSSQTDEDQPITLSEVQYYKQYSQFDSQIPSIFKTFDMFDL